MTIPHWLLATIGAAVSVGPIATMCLWGFVWLRIEQSARTVPTLRRGQRLAAADPPTGQVCVVVPAHDEAATIAALIRSLRAETYPEFSVVLALDRCTDATAAVARAAIAGDARFAIVELDDCPESWAGKVHAVHAGVTRSPAAAAADYLLFADADTTFEPGCIAAALALMRERRLDLLSLLSTLTHDAWYERVVQTAAALELMRQYPLTLANAPNDRRAFANGQFMLFRRDAYDAVGGHAAVKDALLEDLALARRIVAAGRTPGVFFAAGLFRCRMYASWPAFRRGWKRIYIEAAGRQAKRLLRQEWRVRWLGTILPAWMLAALPVGALVVTIDPVGGWTLLALALAALAVWAGALARIAALAQAPLWTGPLHIVGAWLTANLFAEAAADLSRNTPTRWGGREYDMTSGKARASDAEAPARGHRAMARGAGRDTDGAGQGANGAREGTAR